MSMRKLCQYRISLVAIAALISISCSSSYQQQKGEKQCNVQSISLNKIVKVFDGNWQGMTVASDGSCYFGASSHSPIHGVGFFRFDPDKKKLTVVAEDMTKICGEDLTKTPPQGKIHSPIVECDGWLYFATHLASYWDEAIDRFTGAHVIGYELATGKFRDFGVVRPRFTIYSAINVDPVRRKLFVFVMPFAKEDVQNDGCHLYRIDIDTGKKEDLGLVVEKGKGACFWFFLDSNGNCWFTTWKFHWRSEADKGNLYCVRGDTDKIECYKNVLPAGRLAPNGEPAPKTKMNQRAWTWAQALPGRERCLFTMGYLGGGDERLWIFDPSKNIESGEAFQPVAYIGSTFLSVAVGGDRVYFIQYRDLEYARSKNSEVTRDKKPEEIDFPAQLHLRSISIAPKAAKAVLEHGKIVDQDGRTPRMIESLGADAAGRVYMEGSWYIKSEEEATSQYIWKGQTIWPDARDETFKVMNRGEFFAFVDISEDLK